MEVIQFDIPAAGEQKELGVGPGKAFQFARLGWEGSSDPLGNPKIYNDKRTIDTLATVGNPIEETWERLTVENPSGGTQASGSTAILYKYDRTGIQPFQRKAQKVFNGTKVLNIGEGFGNLGNRGISVTGDTSTPPSGKEETLISSGRSNHERLQGVSVDLSLKNSMPTGYRVDLRLKLGQNRYVEAILAPVKVGRSTVRTFSTVNGLLVPKDDPLTLEMTAGKAGLKYEFRGSSIYDNDNPVPPR